MIPRLCFITDTGAPLPPIDQAEAAVRGGAGWIQLRDKHMPDQAFAELARAMIAKLSPLGVPLIINDRIHVALAVDAPGLHIGQSDGDPLAVRATIGPDMILGLSIETEDQMAYVPKGVTYLGVGPIRATNSKTDHAAPMGFDGLARAMTRTSLPCMAIGGLTADDIPALQTAGCQSVAIVSAISRAQYPEDAARAFVTNWSAT